MSDQEQERLKRLRDRQLAARDPLIKQRQFQSSSALKEKRMRKPFSLAKEWADIPHIVKTPLYMLLLGCAVLLALFYLWDSSWALPVGFIALVIFVIFGAIVGNAQDLRDDIKHNLS